MALFKSRCMSRIQGTNDITIPKTSMNSVVSKKIRKSFPIEKETKMDIAKGIKTWERMRMRISFIVAPYIM